MANEGPTGGSRLKASWIIGGFIGLGLLCGCAGIGLGLLCYTKGNDGEEWMLERRAALSGKGHHDPFSAPEGSTVHVGGSAAMGPRPMDTMILQGPLRQNLGVPEVQDAQPSEPWRLHLYQDPGASAPTRAEIDLDRDGNIDEIWKVDGTRVRRAVSTNDNGDYDQTWLWQDGLWLQR